MTRRARLEPSRMQDKQLFAFVRQVLREGDMRDPAYLVMDRHQRVLYAIEALKELEMRGTQLSLFGSEPKRPA